MPQTTSSMITAYITALELVVIILRRIANENNIRVDDMNETDEDKENYEFIEKYNVTI